MRVMYAVLADRAKPSPARAASALSRSTLDTLAIFWELSVVEHRYKAVPEVTARYRWGSR